MNNLRASGINLIAMQLCSAILLTQADSLRENEERASEMGVYSFALPVARNNFDINVQHNKKIVVAEKLRNVNSHM